MALNGQRARTSGPCPTPSYAHPHRRRPSAGRCLTESKPRFSRPGRRRDSGDRRGVRAEPRRRRRGSGQWRAFSRSIAEGQVATEEPFVLGVQRYTGAAAATDPRTRELLDTGGRRSADPARLSGRRAGLGSAVARREGSPRPRAASPDVGDPPFAGQEVELDPAGPRRRIRGGRRDSADGSERGGGLQDGTATGSGQVMGVSCEIRHADADSLTRSVRYSGDALIIASSTTARRRPVRRVSSPREHKSAASPTPPCPSSTPVPRPRPAAPVRGALRDGLDLQPGMAVGLFGGSFNPAHDGHAHVAETAMRRLGLDRVVWLVSPQNPLKDAADTAPAGRAHGLGPGRGGAGGAGPSMIVSDFETRVGTPMDHRHPARPDRAASGRALRLADGVGQSGQFPPLARLDRHHADDAGGRHRPARHRCWKAAPPRPPRASPRPRIPTSEARAAADDAGPGLDLSDGAAEPPLLDRAARRA